MISLPMIGDCGCKRYQLQKLICLQFWVLGYLFGNLEYDKNGVTLQYLLLVTQGNLIITMKLNKDESFENV